MNQIQNCHTKSNRKISIHKTDEIEYSNRYETLYTDDNDTDDNDTDANDTDDNDTYDNETLYTDDNDTDDNDNFIQMIMITNLAIHAIVLPLQTAVPCLRKFLTKFHRVIHKRKKSRKISTKRKETKGNNKNDKNTVIKEIEGNGKCEVQTIKERKGNLDNHKNWYYHEPQATIEK